MAKQHALKHPVQVCKMQKHHWGVTMQLPTGEREIVDGFDSKQQAKRYASRAADIIAIRTGQGF